MTFGGTGGKPSEETIEKMKEAKKKMAILNIGLEKVCQQK